MSLMDIISATDLSQSSEWKACGITSPHISIRSLASCLRARDHSVLSQVLPGSYDRIYDLDRLLETALPVAISRRSFSSLSSSLQVVEPTKMQQYLSAKPCKTPQISCPLAGSESTLPRVLVPRSTVAVKGGIYVLSPCFGLELDVLDLDRFHNTEQPSKSDANSECHRNRMRRLGPTWWKSEKIYNLSQLDYPKLTDSFIRVGSPAGGSVWVLKANGWGERCADSKRV
ncbi:hypothetical protein V1527DRAFT_509761 [Lipomyces starkeyi]